MAKTKPDEPIALPVSRFNRWYWRVGGGAVVVVVLLVGSFELVYAGKVFPGVSADGVYLSGLSQTDAGTHIVSATSSYTSAVLAVNYNASTLHIPLNSLGIHYDSAKAATLAYTYGRTGSWVNRLHQQARALLGRSTNFAVYTYDDTTLTPYLGQISDAVSTPVSNASLSFNDNQAQVTPAANGNRLNLGLLVMSLENSMATTSTSAITAPVYAQAAAVSTAALALAAPQATIDLTSPLLLTYDNNTTTVSQATIASWIKVSGQAPGDFIDTLNLTNLYPADTTATLSVDQTAITSYVAGLAAQLDQTPTNAQLAEQNGTLVVTAAEKDGIKLNQTTAVKSITAALSSSSTSRTVPLDVTVAKADVRQDNLASLGITGLISEGETYFPGSPAGRLQNVRAGAAKFNDVLLAPGQVFSFGALLGEVDASTGYVPELVILGDHEADQYGGGLCQVSTTAFRAALLAGLPINERVNHAFAISYYTWPYGVPGVDATIYYPAVDMKFTNDTGHYILIQTTMKGTDLKFDYYGTKTKQGVVRGPVFVSGSSDATQPSHTTFWRDVEDLSGNVIKTDTFQTYYQPSTDFPVETASH